MRVGGVISEPVRWRVVRSGRARFAGRVSAAALFSLVVVLSVAPGAPAFAADAPLSPQQQQGQQLYRSTCFYCHSEKVWGTLAIERRRGASDALLEKRTDLVPAFVKSVVRNGLGSMPPYRRTELTDADVELIIAYLTRGNPASVK